MSETELSKILEAALEGRGARLIDEATLLELYRLAASRKLLLDGVEPFKIDGELQQPHVHLTFTPTEIYGSYTDLPWADRIIAVRQDIESLLIETRRVGGEFRFNAYFSREEDWR